jgi:hypothetical protein
MCDRNVNICCSSSSFCSHLYGTLIGQQVGMEEPIRSNVTINCVCYCSQRLPQSSIRRHDARLDQILRAGQQERPNNLRRVLVIASALVGSIAWNVITVVMRVQLTEARARPPGLTLRWHRDRGRRHMNQAISVIAAPGAGCCGTRRRV